MVVIMLKIKRLLACYIDFIIFLLFFSIPLEFLNDDFLKNDSTDISLFIIVFMIIFLLLFAFKDIITGNRSIGKRILKLYILDENGNICKNKKILLKRNIRTLELFPMYVFNILQDNKSSGDCKYHTIVESK